MGDELVGGKTVGDVEELEAYKDASWGSLEGPASGEGIAHGSSFCFGSCRHATPVCILPLALNSLSSWRRTRLLDLDALQSDVDTVVLKVDIYI